MTQSTANLSVGINTSKAKEALRELKGWMANDLKIAVAIDPQSIDRSIQGYLKSRKFGITLDLGQSTREVVQKLETEITKAFKGGDRAAQRTISWNQAAFTGGLNSALKSAFSFSERKVNFSRSALETEVSLSIAAGMNKQHRLHIDQAALTTDIKMAVAAGLAGAHLSPGVGAGAAPAMPVGALQAAIAQSLTPAMEEIGKAAALMSGTLRKMQSAEPGAATAAAKSRAKVSYSAKDEDGGTIGVSRALGDPTKALANITDINERKAQAKMEADSSRETFRARRALRRSQETEAQRDAREEQQDANRTFAARRAFRRSQETAAQAEAREAQADSNRTFAARRAFARSQETEAQREAREAQADSNRTYAARRSFARAQESEEQRAAREAQQDSNRTFAARRSYARAQEGELQRAGREAQADSNRTYAARRSFARAQAGEEQRAAREAQADSNRTYAARRAFARAEETQAQREQREAQADSNRTFAARRAFRRSQEAAAQAEMARAYQDAKDDARRSYTGRGVNIAAAQTLQKQFPTTAAQFLGKDAGLLNRGNELEDYRRKVAGAGSATAKAAAEMHPMKAVLKDIHDGARGLAGSLGLLWLTWGSLVPLAAGAAIGATLRSVLTVGKQVEYQLAFVSVLSEGAIVQQERFTQSVRGGLTAPIEAANALRGLAQNGLNVRESLIALPGILELATAGEMGLSQAALGATGVMAAFNLQVSDLGRIGDVFAKAAASSNTSVSMMVESMKQASTVSDKYHVSLEETAASLAVMAKRNILGTAAGTAFRNMLNELATPSKKAREAFKDLHLELYDGNNELKSYQDVLGQLRNATINLNEKGRLTFLNEVFGERGAKAANSLLSDFGLLQQQIKSLKEESNGFAHSVTTALGETTDGKLKKLMTEFQLATTAAFNGSSDAVKNFTDAMRVAVGSDEFAKRLEQITGGVTKFTRFLLENVGVLTQTVVLWGALKVGAIALVPAINLVLGSFAALRAVALGTLSAMTGGLGLIAVLAIEYFTLKKNTTAATEAQEAYTNRLKVQDQAATKQIINLREEIDYLGEQNRLMWDGVSALDARAAAQKNLSAATIADQRASINRELLKVSEGLITYGDRTQNRKNRPWEGGAQYDPAKVAELKDREKGLLEQQELLNKQEADLFTGKALTNLRDHLAGRQSIVAEIEKVNTEIRDINKSGKYHFEPISLVAAERMDDETARRAIKSKKEEMDRERAGFNRRDPEAERAYKAEMQSELQALIEKFNREEDELKRHLAFKKQIDETRFASDRFGPQIAAIAAEARARDERNKTLAQEVRELQQLGELRNKMKDPSQIAHVDREIQRRVYTTSTSREGAENESTLANLRATRDTEKDDDNFQKMVDRLKSEAKQARDSLEDKTIRKAMDPADAAASKAALEVSKVFRTDILKLEDEINREKLGSLELDGDALSAAQAQIATDEARLKTLRQIAKEQTTVSAANARQQELNSQTAQYGWDKFWNEYRSNAESSAKQVYDIMKSSTDSFTGMWQKFVTTGKLDFKGFVASVLSDVTKMLASKAMTKLLGIAADALFSGGSVNMGTTTTGADLSTFYASANGNVMTSSGPLPLNAFAGGGIARRPMVSLIGEGRTPEAYVPLPDGRSIPVTMEGGGGGGNTTVSIAVHIDSNGKSQVESDTSGEKAKQLATVLEGAMTERLQREKRPGGLLYRMG